MVEICLAEGRCELFAATSCWEKAAPHLTGRRVALLFDEALPAALVQRATSLLSPALGLPLPRGEAAKSLGAAGAAFSALARANFTRNDLIVALGGGATSDAAGWIAANHLRGLPWLIFPTTLLAAVDASIGGKTAIDLPEGKNLVGAFWLPRGVYFEPEVLRTLPEAEIRSGMAEAFKHALLEGKAEEFLSNLNRSDLTNVAAGAMRYKAGVVQQDPTERGLRAILNLGHTFGHALEAAASGTLPHGFAIGHGLVLAALLSQNESFLGQAMRFLEWQRPTPPPNASFEALWAYMLRDKKSDALGPRFVLLHEDGPTLRHVGKAEAEAAFLRWQNGLE